MREKWLLCKAFFKVKILTRFQFPVAYWLGFFGQIVTYGANFVVIAIAVSSFGELHGWKAEEILLLYAFTLMSYAIGAFFTFLSSTGLADNIRSGAFDMSLTKPMNPFLFQMLNYDLELAYLSHFTLALGVMIYALVRVGFAATLGNIVLLVLFVLGASAIQGALQVFASLFSFHTVNENPMFMVVSQWKDFLKYPISIYGSVLQIILTIFLPIGFINFYPAQYLLSKPDGLFSPWLGLLTPVVGTGLFLLAYKLWMRCLKHYNSSGS